MKKIILANFLLISFLGFVTAHAEDSYSPFNNMMGHGFFGMGWFGWFWSFLIIGILILLIIYFIRKYK